MAFLKSWAIGISSYFLMTGLFAASAKVVFFMPCSQDVVTGKVLYPQETLEISAQHVSKRNMDGSVVQYSNLPLNTIHLKLENQDRGLCYQYADLTDTTSLKTPLLLNEHGQISSIQVMGSGAVTISKFTISTQNVANKKGKTLYFDLYDNIKTCEKLEKAICTLSPDGAVSYFVWSS